MSDTSANPGALPDPSVKPLLRPREAAALARVSDRHIHTLARRGDIAAIYVGHALRIPTAQFLVFLGLRNSRELPDHP